MYENGTGVIKNSSYRCHIDVIDVVQTTTT